MYRIIWYPHEQAWHWTLLLTSVCLVRSASLRRAHVKEGGAFSARSDLRLEPEAEHPGHAQQVLPRRRPRGGPQRHLRHGHGGQRSVSCQSFTSCSASTNQSGPLRMRLSWLPCCSLPQALITRVWRRCSGSWRSITPKTPTTCSWSASLRWGFTLQVMWLVCVCGCC